MQRQHSEPTIIESLTDARSRIHLVCDAWTSPNSYAIWGIQAQYIDFNWHSQSIAIDLRHLQGTHDGRSLANGTSYVIDDYNIGKILRYIVLDSATNSDTMLKVLAEDLQRQDVDWDPIHH